MKMQPLRSVRLDQVGATLLAPLQPAEPSWPRRLAFIGPVLLLTALGTGLAAHVTAGVAGWVRWPMLALVAANLLYAALTGWPGMLGFLVRVFGRPLRTGVAPAGLSRTAVLMPIHREDPAAVFAAIAVMAQEAAGAGLQRIEFFVLSDTQDAACAADEARAYAGLRAVPGVPVHYRRRTSNAGRKVGNIGEFCHTHGARFDYMVVLDADSLMGASAISNLIGLMDANPRVGMVQTVPYPVGRETLFARFQQFSARLYTPMLVEGLTFWQQGDGNYWGHNAIVRVAPFMAHCNLPILPGREPFGGEILCHDVVEAAFIRAAGWEVWVLPEVVESYEALPANMVDFASRERRWCQGNLQHVGLLRFPGLRPVGRFHLGYGIAHYVAGPVVAALLAGGTLDALAGWGFTTALLGATPAHLALAGLTLALLYGSKLLALGMALADREQSRAYGGRLALLGSAVAEQLGALVLSAVLVAFYTRYAANLLLGQAVRWDSQPRDDRGVSWAEGSLRFRSMFALGAAWLGLVALSGSGALLGWASPLLAGLLLAVPAVVWSSRTTLGAAARRIGLFVTPEERAPPGILRAYARAVLRQAEPARHGPVRLPVAAEAD